jgi:ATP synthase protein I
MRSGCRFFPVVRWVLGAQLTGIGVIAIVFELLGDGSAAMSALAGGLVAFVPNLVFSLGFGVRDDRRTAKQVAGLFFGGEVLKLLLTGVLFAVLFQFQSLLVLPMMAGFVGALTFFWFALLVRGSFL